MKSALIQLHVAVMLWGFTGVLGRLIKLDAPVLVWYRMLLTAILLALLISIAGMWHKISKKGILQLSGIGILMAIHWIAFYAAIQFSNASIALVCLSTASIFTSLLEPLINKSAYQPKELLLGLFALVGMYLIYRFQHLQSIGIILGIFAALLSSIFTIFNKRIAADYPVRTMLFYEMSSGFLIISLCLPFLLYFMPSMRLIPTQDALIPQIGQGLQAFLINNNDWVWLLILALCCTVWAQSLALSALKKLNSFTITLSVNLEPVYGILLAILIFREDKELHQQFFLGMALICISVLLQIYFLIRDKKKGTLKS